MVESVLVWVRTIHDHTEIRASLLRLNKEALDQSREIDARQKARMAQSRAIEALLPMLFDDPHSPVIITPGDSNTGGETSNKPSVDGKLENQATTPEDYRETAAQSREITSEDQMRLIIVRNSYSEVEFY